MCSVMGVVDPQNMLDEAELSQLVNSLARAGEVKGDHAAGIAYVNPHGVLMTHIEPRPASEINFAIPSGTKIVTIHCRLATQGDYHLNYCNHPFVSKLQGKGRLALCHNGVLFQTEETRKRLKIESTPIETDSFLASQILSQNKELSVEAITDMTEKIQGSYVFTILEEQNILWLVKGDNLLEMIELSLQRGTRDGKIIVYGTNMSILLNALSSSSLSSCIQAALFDTEKQIKEITIMTGTIVKIEANGNKEFSKFDFKPFYQNKFLHNFGCSDFGHPFLYENDFKELTESFSLDEIEDMIYE